MNMVLDRIIQSLASTDNGDDTLSSDRDDNILSCNDGGQGDRTASFSKHNAEKDMKIVDHNRFSFAIDNNGACEDALDAFDCSSKEESTANTASSIHRAMSDDDTKSASAILRRARYAIPDACAAHAAVQPGTDARKLL